MKDTKKLRAIAEAAKVLGCLCGLPHCAKCCSQSTFEQSFDPPTTLALLDELDRLREALHQAENALDVKRCLLGHVEGDTSCIQCAHQQSVLRMIRAVLGEKGE